MADLKPQDVIEVLTQDHREVEEMFVKLEAMQPATTPAQRKRRKDLVDQVTIELIRHAVAEEAEVYPAVQDKLTKKEAERARKEHAEAEETMKRLERLEPEDSGFEAELATLMREIREHVAEEEGEMFPRMREVFTQDELDKLGLPGQGRQDARSDPAAPVGAGPAAGRPAARSRRRAVRPVARRGVQAGHRAVARPGGGDLAPARHSLRCRRTSTSVPSATDAVIQVQCGWRLRSVGDPGLSRRSPRGGRGVPRDVAVPEDEDGDVREGGLAPLLAPLRRTGLVHDRDRQPVHGRPTPPRAAARAAAGRRCCRSSATSRRDRRSRASSSETSTQSPACSTTSAASTARHSASGRSRARRGTWVSAISSRRVGVVMAPAYPQAPRCTAAPPVRWAAGVCAARRRVCGRRGTRATEGAVDGASLTVSRRPAGARSARTRAPSAATSRSLTLRCCEADLSMSNAASASQRFWPMTTPMAWSIVVRDTRACCSWWASSTASAAARRGPAAGTPRLRTPRRGRLLLPKASGRSAYRLSAPGA